jgi:hypothetical protein
LKCIEDPAERDVYVSKIKDIVDYHDNYKQLYLLPLQDKARQWINAEKEELNKMKAQL